MLIIYKGYEKEFLEENIGNSLIDRKKLENEKKEKISQVIITELTTNAQVLKEKDKWISYDHFSICYKNLIMTAQLFEIAILIYENNKYYNIYPVEKPDTSYLEKLLNNQEEDNLNDSEDEVYSYVYKINNDYYVEYYNYEYDYKDVIQVKKRYNKEFDLLPKSNEVEYIFEITESKEDYLMNLLNIQKINKIGIIQSVNSNITNEMCQGLLGYLQCVNKKVYAYENVSKIEERHEKYIEIARNKIGIPNFENFKTLKIYKNPLESNELTNISQAQIIDEIVTQVELSKQSDDSNNYYRDVFVTAPTGAGKSVIFQIPAVYAAEKYGGLAIVISPLVELMNDQVENLQNRGYNRVARLNSDINAFEKEQILKEINERKIDILYLSPEALLSYSIESIIGTRDISMVIVDEAHIVTTWGQGFRPDYWYLGTYFEKLRRARYKGGRLDLTSRKYNFVICTFTATAVYGGEDDGVNELIESLYLKDPIKFIGEVKRKDITFDIEVHRDKINTTETMGRKAKDLDQKVLKWQKNNEKSLIYFPYNSIAQKAYSKSEEFSAMEYNSEFIGIYTGQTRTDIKKDSARKYKDNLINTMFATKAFGMGIDIKDIKHVYHYAEGGNLNDYVQEIGRVARDVNMNGIAHMDYYNKDMNYARVLYGMSAIKQTHVMGCLRVLKNVYERSQKRNNIITPSAFENVFPSDPNLETTVKTALLNIEKDLNAKYRIPVIITRPRSMFTNTYVAIDDKIIREFIHSEYYKYFKYIDNGRNKEKENNVYISDVGNIYVVDLKSLWEDMFSEMSFPAFKYHFYSNRERILENYAQYVYPRLKIDIQTTDENTSFVGIYDKLCNNIEQINKILGTLKAKQGEFTKLEFKKLLNEQFQDANIAENIANGYLSCIEDDKYFITPFYSRKNVGDGVRYRILTSSYRFLAENLITKNSLLKELNNLDVNKVVRYKSADSTTMKKTSKILNLLAMFNMIQYNTYGGENPEIFIRINDPYRIKAIANGEIQYKNKIVEKAAIKHNRDIKIITKFINELDTDEDRWNFIEDYFLGKDVIQES